VPADRLKILRASFQAMLKAPSTLKDAKKLRVEINPSTAEQSAAVLRKAYAAPASVVAKARSILLSKKKKKKKKK